jgi:Terminase RNaseH-like domain
VSKAAVMVGWQDVPHLSEEQKKSILSGIPPWQRQARTLGLPSIGAGAIYPLDESDIVIAPFEIPHHWARGYGFDTGWNRTAGIFLARDPDSGGWVAYKEYYRGKVDPAIHVRGLKQLGADWMTGVIDPAARGQRGLAGEKLLDVYRDMGLNLELADNAVGAGITMVWDWLSTGKLKFFSNLSNTLAEFRLYQRDEKGNIVKANDHLMDALRYAVMTLMTEEHNYLKTPPTSSSGTSPWFQWNPPPVWSG